MLSHVVEHKATKDDIAAARTELKGDIVRFSEQVASIETQRRDSKRHKRIARVADLAENVFNQSRA
jgi:hypothetical protein